MVRKEKTERSWRTESERNSLMVDSRGRGDAGVACVDVGWKVLAALADAANDELDSCRGGRSGESGDDEHWRWELRGADPTTPVAISAWALAPATPARLRVATTTAFVLLAIFALVVVALVIFAVLPSSLSVTGCAV